MCNCEQDGSLIKWCATLKTKGDKRNDDEHNRVLVVLELSSFAGGDVNE